MLNSSTPVCVCVCVCRHVFLDVLMLLQFARETQITTLLLNSHLQHITSEIQGKTLFKNNISAGINIQLKSTGFKLHVDV